tara:strand:+ start:293 stop:4144 length:3852 start_codon:yes stop_codon:yes gene_type:complete
MPFELMGGRMTQVGGGAAIDNDKFSRALEKIKEASLSKYGYRMSDEEARKVASGQTSKVNIRKKTMDRVDRDVRNELAVSGLTGMYRGAPTMKSQELTAQFTGYWQGKSTLERDWNVARIKSQEDKDRLAREEAYGINPLTGAMTLKRQELNHKVNIEGRDMSLREVNAALERAVKQGQQTGVYIDPETKDTYETLQSTLQKHMIDRENAAAEADIFNSLGLTRIKGSISAADFGVDVTEYWDADEGRITDVRKHAYAAATIREAVFNIFGEDRLTNGQINMLTFGKTLDDILLKNADSYEFDKKLKFEQDVQLGMIDGVRTLNGMTFDLESDMTEWKKAEIRARAAGDFIDPVTKERLETIQSKQLQMAMWEVTGYLDDGSPTAAMAIAKMDRDLQRKKIFGFDKQVKNEETGEWEWVHVYGTNELQLVAQTKDIKFRERMETGFWFVGEDGADHWWGGTTEAQMKLSEAEWQQDEKTRMGHHVWNEHLGRFDYIVGTQEHDGWKERLRDSYLRDGLEQADAHMMVQIEFERKQWEGYTAYVRNPDGSVKMHPQHDRPMTKYVVGKQGLEKQHMELKKTLTQMTNDAESARQIALQLYEDKKRNGYWGTDNLGNEVWIWGTQDWEERKLEKVQEIEDATRAGRWAVDPHGMRYWVEGTQGFDARMQRERNQLVKDGWEEERIQAREDFERRHNAEWGHYVADPRDPSRVLWVEGTKTREWQHELDFLKDTQEGAESLERVRSFLQQQGEAKKWSYQLLENGFQRSHDLTLLQKEHIHKTNENMLDRETEEAIAQIKAAAAEGLLDKELTWKEIQLKAEEKRNQRKAISGIVGNIIDFALKRKVYDLVWGEEGGERGKLPTLKEALSVDYWFGKEGVTEVEAKAIVAGAEKSVTQTYPDGLPLGQTPENVTPPGEGGTGGTWRLGVAPTKTQMLGAVIAGYAAYKQGGPSAQLENDLPPSMDWGMDMAGMAAAFATSGWVGALAYGLGRWAAHAMDADGAAEYWEARGQYVPTTLSVRRLAPKDMLEEMSYSQKNQMKTYIQWPVVNERGWTESEGVVKYTDPHGREIGREGFVDFMSRNDVSIMPITADMMKDWLAKNPDLKKKMPWEPRYLWIWGGENVEDTGVSIWAETVIDEGKAAKDSEFQNIFLSWDGTGNANGSIKDDPYLREFFDAIAHGSDVDTDKGQDNLQGLENEVLSSSGLTQEVLFELSDGLGEAEKYALFRKIRDGEEFTHDDIEEIFKYRPGMGDYQTGNMFMKNYFAFDDLVNSGKIKRRESPASGF